MKRRRLDLKWAIRLTGYRHIGLTLLAGLALAVIALVFFSWLASEVLEGDTQYFDEQVRAAINQYSSPRLTALMRTVTYLGSTTFLLALGVCVIITFILIKWHRAALSFTLTMAGAFVLNNVLKWSFQRMRPAPFFGITAPGSYSFPSGHALLSLCFFGTLAAVINGRVKRAGAQLMAWIVASTLILLIGLSRIYLGVHYPSDVIAGYAAAFIWVMAVAFVDRLLSSGEHRGSK